MRSVFLAIGLVGLLVLAILSSCFCIGFSMGCNQYLKRAADANTVELAKQNLEKSIRYLDAHDLTNGIVSIFLHQPQNDIGFWYSNLTSSMEELSKVNDKATQLEKSNILMKLRETLTDNGENGLSVTCPDGISVYPYNALFFWLTIAFSVSLIMGAVGFAVEF